MPDPSVPEAVSPASAPSRALSARVRPERLLLTTLLLTLAAAALAFGLLPSWIGRSLNGTVDAHLPAPSAEALALHATLDVVDLHSDALLWSRDLLVAERWGHVDIPRLRAGRVAVQGFTVVTKTPRGMNVESNRGDSDNITLLVALQRWPPATWTSLTARALHQAERLRELAARSGGALTLLETRADLDAFLARRAADPSAVAGFLGVEGAHALEGDLARVDTLFRAGFRMLGPTHFFDNDVGGSAHGVDKGGLTPFGARVVERAGELGMLLDLAHASQTLFDDVLARARGPVVVSHGGVKGTCSNSRTLDDGRLRALAATGGAIGIGLWETVLCGRAPSDWARAVHHAVEVMGIDGVALGSDWDGAVRTVVDAAGTVYLVDSLLNEGFGEAEVRKIMGENALRVLGEALPAGAR